jgi:ribose/xylose/arabinose/galactoside ABC-type transport system permease subunit
MTGYGFFNLIRAFCVFAFVAVMGSFFIVQQTVLLILQEVRFRRLYGNDWVQMYQKYEEPLSQTNFKIGLGISYVLAVFVFSWWLYRRFALKKARRSRRRY